MSEVKLTVDDSKVKVISMADGLYNAIAHGDDDHRAWLREAINNYFAGKPIPAVRGGQRVQNG